jgi:predicted ester cyclase
MSQSGRQVVREYVEAFNRGELDRVCAAFAPDAQILGGMGWGNLTQARQAWLEMIGCFGMQLEIEEMVVEGNSIAVRYTERGLSCASYRGGPVTGRPYEVMLIEWFVIEDGLIRRRWGVRDMVAMFGQMGLPLPAQAQA